MSPMAMNSVTLAFDPLIDWPLLIAGAMLALSLCFFGLWRKLRGSLFRGISALFLLGFLCNPLLVEEDREAVDDVALIIVDESDSQKIENRRAVTETALSELSAQLDRYPNLQTRILRQGSAGTSGRAINGAVDGTHLFSRLEEALIDLDPAQLAGAILITDGQVHDAPQGKQEIEKIPANMPVHGLLTGKREEVDRQLSVVRSPRFGIVGEPFSITLRVDDKGTSVQSQLNSLAQIEVRIDGEVAYRNRIFVNRDHEIANILELAHGGENVIEVEVDGLPGELTDLNNSTAILINGIRDRLRVLLVSGEPHAGERVWRNLLKSDPSVDLVHFTILRPPEKQDGTPIGELSLIAFPTRQLFSIKLYEFDLIIFDRYRRRGVLPLLYLNNIAEYVERGGALLTAVGPPFASPYSLYRTPLSAVLPARPTGDVLTGGFRPEVTKDGLRHPVTASLNQRTRLALNEASKTISDDAGQPDWGKWFRLIDSTTHSGQVLMSGAEEKPLLVLDRVGDGRVAQLMSDHAWLWARGYDGGGPQAEMLRRLAHWLMKEPDLEEEILSGEHINGELHIQRRTMSDSVGLVSIDTPSGDRYAVDLRETVPGLWEGSAPVSEVGLHRLSDGEQMASVAVGPINPLEFEDVRTTDQRILATSQSTGGGINWLSPETGKSEDLRLPKIRRVISGRDAAGKDWIGLRRNNQYIVRSLSHTSLFLAPLALLLITASLLWAWYREGRR